VFSRMPFASRAATTRPTCSSMRVIIAAYAARGA
jgi:hypothetical protein